MEKKKNVPQGILRTMQDDIQGVQLGKEQVFNAITPGSPNSNQQRASQNKIKSIKPEANQGGGLPPLKQQSGAQPGKGPTPIAIVPSKKQKPKQTKQMAEIEPQAITPTISKKHTPVREPAMEQKRKLKV